VKQLIMASAVLLVTGLGTVSGVQVQAATPGEDGLHKAPWMRERFKDLGKANG